MAPLQYTVNRPPVTLSLYTIPLCTFPTVLLRLQNQPQKAKVRDAAISTQYNRKILSPSLQPTKGQ